MIDLQEPRSIQYSEQDKVILKDQFILLLHTLLLVYLGLHNLLIPLVSNILKSQPLMSDVHFWFLFQLPVQGMLRKKMPISTWYLYFLILGSISRLGIELYLATNLKSWSILSVLISELSSGIFYFLYFPSLKIKKFSLIAISGLFIAPSLSTLEIRSSNQLLTPLKLVHEQSVQHLGCQGSVNNLVYPLHTGTVQEALSITSCGFEKNLIFVNKDFNLINQTNVAINLRLYKLQVLHGRVKWKFVRLVQLESHRIWNVSQYIKTDTAYLIKSPERRKIGHVVIVPELSREFPLGPGTLGLTFDTLNWTPNE